MKMYAIVTKGNKLYAAHIGFRERYKFDTFKDVTKAEYQKARSEGVPSWGEYETQCKREGRNPF